MNLVGDKVVRKLARASTDTELSYELAVDSNNGTFMPAAMLDLSAQLRGDAICIACCQNATFPQ